MSRADRGPTLATLSTPELIPSLGVIRARTAKRSRGGEMVESIGVPRIGAARESLLLFSYTLFVLFDAFVPP